MKPFSKLCDCNIELIRNSHGGSISYSSSKKELYDRIRLENLGKSQSTDSVPFFQLPKGERLTAVFLALILIVCVIGGIGAGIDYIVNQNPDKAIENKTYVPSDGVANDLKPITRSAAKLENTITVYSGECVMYKQTLVDPNTKKLTQMQVASGKVVFDKAAKKLSFFFDGKLVGNWSNVMDYIDNNQGGEGFSMGGEWSAHRYSAERQFVLYQTSNSGEALGYQFEINQYKVD